MSNHPAPARSGVVLAGGRSRRMGTDKAVLVHEGRRLVDRAVGALSAACDDLVVASGRRRLPGLEGITQVGDTPADVGPIGGLSAALAAAEHDLAFVLAVDLPTPDVGLLEALVERWQGDAAIIPSCQGRPQPLHAVWSTAAAPGLALLAQGQVRSIIDAARELGATFLDDAQTASLVDHDRWAWNVNRPSDLDTGRP